MPQSNAAHPGAGQACTPSMRRCVKVRPFEQFQIQLCSKKGPLLVRHKERSRNKQRSLRRRPLPNSS